jgi:hypothetical protein
LPPSTPNYRDAAPFEPPPGIVAVPVATTSTLPSGTEAVATRDEYFIEGTVPQQEAPRQGGGGILSRLFHSGNASNPPGAAATSTGGSENTGVSAPNADASQPSEEKKSGVLRRFFSLFKGKNPKDVNPPDPPKKTPPEG